MEDLNMIPILYAENETNFNHNGIGQLHEVIGYEVTEVRNGEFELMLEYPVSGQWFKEISDMRLILADPNDTDDPHLFRIYEITKVLSTASVLIYAGSITNDLGGNMVRSVTISGETGQQAMNKLKAALIEPTNFNFVSDIQTATSTKWENRNALNCIAGEQGSLIQYWGGEIKRNVKLLGTKYKYDFVITEIGGTVGDIESLPFIESVRQLKWELGKNCLNVHLTYVPYIAAAKEFKTKPTQHSVKQLQELGIQPDILVLRTEHTLKTDILRKVALFCNVAEEAVVQSVDVPTIYEVPLVLQRQGMDVTVLKKVGLEVGETPDLKQWKEFLNKKNAATETVKIGLVGKYVELQDAYKSIDESLLHAAIYNDRKLDLHLFHSEKITDENAASQLADMDGILIAPGFGQRGIEGKFSAIKFARENNKPLFGICLGMQCMVIEFARNVLGYSDANSTEMEPNTPHKVIDMMEEQKTVINLGGSMRLGAFDCVLKKDSKAFQAYGKEHIQERHRHRFEFNNEYKGEFEAAGMKCVGTNPDTNLVEVVEIPDLKWFVGVQYHPEYNSTVVNPNPLFISFIKAAINNK